MAEPTLHPTLSRRAHLHHKWFPTQSADRGKCLRCETGSASIHARSGADAAQDPP